VIAYRIDNSDKRITRRIRQALTIVELLVVISIIGILVAMLLPAIHAAREASRVATCKSNLKQIGLAMHMFSDSQRSLPSGGWGYNWQGFSDIGGSLGQPGAWVYSLLPYLEQSSLYHKAIYNSSPPIRDAELRKRLVTPVAIYNCPSRRSAETFATYCPSCGTPIGITGRIDAVTRSDYAANIGDGAPGVRNPQFWPLRFAGPVDLEEARMFTQLGRWPIPPSDWTGISYLRTGVRWAEISDGLSNVILIGEKHVNKREYLSGKDRGDNESMLSGFNNDNHRSTNPAWKYMRDRPRMSLGSFGSAHSAGNFVMCDGSVHTLSYDIDENTFRILGNRRDGRTINVE